MLFLSRNLRILGLLVLLLVLVFVISIKSKSPHMSTFGSMESPLANIHNVTQKINSVSIGEATDRVWTHNECGMARTYSIDELTDHADVIVIGEVEKLDRVINLDRDSSFRQASIHYLSLGQLYQVKIDTVVKGKEPEMSFPLAQPEGYLRKEQHSEELFPSDIEQARKNPSCYRSFDENHRYLLFLDSIAGLDYLLPLRYEPWRFDVTDQLYIFPDSVASGNIRPGPLAALLQQIDAAMQPTPEATFVSPLSPLSPLSPIATPPSR